ncbi:MAG: glycosyltransferase family 4 protein [Chloroflexi bacterium]|nr:glycosyltransferase family 4 protein [Chloroflexota bacterium]
MLVGIDASRALRARRTGTENYSLQLIGHLLALGSEHRFRLYCDRMPPAGLFGCGVTPELRVIPFPRLWTHARLSWEMLQRPPDVLFIPAHVLPLIHRRRSVVTVHDLGYLHYPEAHTRWQRAYLQWSTRWNARRSAHLLVDSQATKADLTARYRLPPGKMTVVYPGRDETLRPVTDPAALEEVRARYGLGERYILHVGTLQPRKNLLRLVEAFVQVHRDGLQLVLAGKRGWLAEPLFRRVEELGLSEAVRFPGYVEDADLPALLSGAACFAFPSLYEGFGFPVLEAQACGTPVVASNVSSIPEVAGDGALLVDPHDTAALAEALAGVLSDEALRADLIRRGLANVPRFSWHRCAEQTLAVLEETSRQVHK